MQIENKYEWSGHIEAELLLPAELSCDSERHAPAEIGEDGQRGDFLDTILQEKGNIHLYEKLGYKRTGKIERISYLMDIVYFEKN